MHNSKPAVSVIIPAYNSAKYIGEAIESVLRQTYPALEIIVVDDGSTDNTSEVVKKYTKSIVIRYIYQENAGPAAARNCGIKAASGEYVAFLDSDDLWLPEKLELQVKKFMSDNTYGLVHTGRIRINIEGEAMTAVRYDAPEGFVFDQLLRRNFICTSSVIVKRSCFSDVGLFSEDRGNKSEDYDMWLRISEKYEVGAINSPMVKYRVNFHGYNRANIMQAYSSEKAVFLKALAVYKGDKVGMENDRLSMLMSKMGRSYLYVKQYKEASKAFFMSMQYKQPMLTMVKNFILYASSGAMCLIRRLLFYSTARG